MDRNRAAGPGSFPVSFHILQANGFLELRRLFTLHILHTWHKEEVEFPAYFDQPKDPSDQRPKLGQATRDLDPYGSG